MSSKAPGPTDDSNSPGTLASNREKSKPTIGTAGWSIPRTVADKFASDGSGLTRYASVFKGVEINSTFYHRHKPQTFERWRDGVPEDFRFSVKLPKSITHEMKLKDIEAAFDEFLTDIDGLIPKLGPLLCQLPPSLKFTASGVTSGLRAIRAAFSGTIVIEPRHRTWASEDAQALLRELAISPVLADPPVVWEDNAFRGTPLYIRLHGSPTVYYSAYSDTEIAAYADILGPKRWCIFDNTASGAAINNALTLVDILKRRDEATAEHPAPADHSGREKIRRAKMASKLPATRDDQPMGTLRRGRRV